MLYARPDISLRITTAFLTVVLDSLRLLELAYLAQTDALLVLSQDNAKSVTKDISYTRTNVFLLALMEPSDLMEDALPVLTDVFAAMLINVLSVRKELTYIMENAYQSAPEEHLSLLLNAKTVTRTA